MDTNNDPKPTKIQRALRERSDYCAIEATIDLIGSKWKVVVLNHLRVLGTLRFNELRRSMPAVTQKMLTSQLRELEADGLVERTVYAVVPPKVEYSLTPLGASLEPILVAMKSWGDDYMSRQAVQ